MSGLSRVDMTAVGDLYALRGGVLVCRRRARAAALRVSRLAEMGQFRDGLLEFARIIRGRRALGAADYQRIREILPPVMMRLRSVIISAACRGKPKKRRVSG